MKAHPRLYVNDAGFTRLAERQRDPWFAGYFDEVKRLADEALDLDTFSFAKDGHNWHLTRARAMQTRILSLALQARVSEDPRYVTAAMQHVQMMHDWEYWSWIAWRAGQSDPSAIFDLSYGENSTTLALVFDWLKPLLSADDIALILRTARRPIDSFLKRFETSWWYGHKDSNWVTVCSGGIGILALSLYDYVPEAAVLLEKVEWSVALFMRHLEETDGAWPEGIGYWNYGMRYAFMYLLSHENATGCSHPLLDAPATRETVYFPSSFCPNGVPCSFGDVNVWRPLPIHHAVAHRVGAEDLLPELRARHPEASPSASSGTGGWPNAAETVLLVPDSSAEGVSTGSVSHKLYGGLDWGFVADKMPNPGVYLALRGGTTEVPHGNWDLMSFHAVMGGEAVVINQGMSEYLDTTFGPHRKDIYDNQALSKNVVLINGVSTIGNTRIKTEKVDFSPGLRGFWMDIKGAYGLAENGRFGIEFASRLTLLVDDESLLILDSIKLPNHGRCEARWHTGMAPIQDGEVIYLTGEQQKSSVMHACNHPGKLYVGSALFTSPTKVPIHVIRWMNEKLETQVVLATWITPGGHQRPLSVQVEGDTVTVMLDQKSLKFDAQLKSQITGR